jgi:GxxExxY protein
MPVEPSEALDQVAAAVISGAREVHRCLGPGFLEATYERALCLELEQKGLRCDRQYRVPVLYKGEPIGESHLDLVVSGLVVVELKAVDQLAEIHRAQLRSYLRASGLTLGLLINFNVTSLLQGVRRVVMSPSSR